MNKFISLPSGIIINANEIKYVGILNHIKLPKRRKSTYELTIQFISDDEPVSFSYDDRDNAQSDYDALKNQLTNN